MRLKLSLLLLFALTTASFAEKHQQYKSYNLQAPLDIPLLLSGNFAELRAHHFHAGLDFKTQSKTGFPVYAAADGYVSRVKVSTGGYGKALYIDHPKLNLTTVYAHLEDYIPPIKRLVKAKHYALKHYNIDFFPDKDAVFVKKGDIIAYSGNSGTSSGPHLHFETRERSTQDPINPLFFGFDIKDSKAPSINGLRIYPQAGEGLVNQQSEGSKFYPLVFYSGKYHLKGNPQINVWGKLGFAINVLDYLDESWNKCGIYSIELHIDSQLIFKQEMDRISYSEMRYLDAHIDQKVRSKSKVDYQYSFQAKPNNPLSIYKEMRDNGVVDFSDSLKHLVHYRITDTHGNTSTLEFTVNSVKQDFPQGKKSEQLLKWNEAHHFTLEQFELQIPKNAFYENQTLTHVPKADERFLSPVFQIDNNKKLLNKKASISIRPNENEHIPRNKMVICKLNENNSLTPLPTQTDGKTLTSKVYNFSSFTVSCDTTAPTLTPVNIYNGKRFDKENTFGFKVKDDFTGMWDYTATIDGQWALFYYEYKKKYIYHTIDPERLEKGKMHHLHFEAWDATGNKASYDAEFYW